MRITGRTRVAGIMGWPVAHSRSPTLHNFWLEEQGIDGAYIPLPVRPEQLSNALRALPVLGFRGCNLTIPHKQLAFSAVDRVEPIAKRIGAINTIIVTPDGGLEGRNTDAFGFRENLRETVPDWNPSAGIAVVLGAGGAARAIVAALTRHGSRRSGSSTGPRHAPSFLLVNSRHRRAGSQSTPGARDLRCCEMPDCSSTRQALAWPMSRSWRSISRCCRFRRLWSI